MHKVFNIFTYRSDGNIWERSDFTRLLLVGTIFSKYYCQKNNLPQKLLFLNHKQLLYIKNNCFQWVPDFGTNCGNQKPSWKLAKAQPQSPTRQTREERQCFFPAKMPFARPQIALLLVISFMQLLWNIAAIKCGFYQNYDWNYLTVVFVFRTSCQDGKCETKTYGPYKVTLEISNFRKFEIFETKHDVIFVRTPLKSTPSLQLCPR